MNHHFIHAHHRLLGSDVHRLESIFIPCGFIHSIIPKDIETRTQKHSDGGGVLDLSLSGDNFDLVVVDPHDPTTTSETRGANAIAEPTPNGYQPCWCKISLITKINSYTHSKNEQEFEVSNLNITRRWSL
jgi:hypothetical protein